MAGGLERTTRLICLSIGSVAFLIGALAESGPRAGGANFATRQDDLQIVALGKALFYDHTLSNPPGLACISCHAPEAGYSYPNPLVNEFFGAVPGAVHGRSGFRKPPGIAYAPFLPTGFPHFDKTVQAYVGGLFWDGRAADAVGQVRFPIFDPNEMNVREHGLPSPEMLADKVSTGPSGSLFRLVYGVDVFKRPASDILDMVSRSIVAFERSPEVSPFTSKYDAYLAGKAKLTPMEMLGMRLATGSMNGRPGGPAFRKSAHCADCHGLSSDLSKQPDLWTNGCYANLGVPRNPLNPYFVQRDAQSNPQGYNRSGTNFVDPGLGDFVYPSLGRLPGDPKEQDPLQIDGLFKAPSLRNVDKRPYPGFVKCYMHNGVFKSLKDVVHFYNSRNLTTYPGEVIDYTLPQPYAHLKGRPLWPPPEDLDPRTLINPTGLAAGMRGRAAATAPTNDPDAQQIGNLGLSELQEQAIVAFLKTLSDGYFTRSDGAAKTMVPER